jgi:hypothetical protein
MYGVNTGRVDAAWYWHCSWARTYLDAKTTRDRATAFTYVLQLKRSAFYQYGLTKDDQKARDKVLARAASGQTEELQQIVNLNCPSKPSNVATE